MSAADAAQRLANLQSYAGYYRKMSERVAKNGGDPEQAFVSYPEMFQILDDINAIFKSAFGVGLKKNRLGQAFPEKRHWEVR